MVSHDLGTVTESAGKSWEKAAQGGGSVDELVQVEFSWGRTKAQLIAMQGEGIKSLCDQHLDLDSVSANLLPSSIYSVCMCFI